MAIIYSYPNLPLSELSSVDTFTINATNANGEIITNTVSLSNLATYITNTGTGSGTTNKIVKFTDGANGLLGDSIMTESTDLIDLAGQFVSTSSPTLTQTAPVSGIKATLNGTTAAPNVALYGESKNTGSTQANSNYGLFAKGEFEGTGGFTGFVIGGSLEGRYDGTGTNGANATIYGSYNLARATTDANGTVSYMVGASNLAKVEGANVTATNLQATRSTVELSNGTAGDVIVQILDFDTTGGGTVTGDLSYLQIQNDTMPAVAGTKRAINSKSVLPSLFTGQVEIPLVPTINAHATSKQYVDQQIASIPAGLVFQGNWDASTNTPTLASGTGTVGNYYVVSVAGNTDLDGITDWEVGDWAVFVEVGGVDKWDKIDQTFVQGAGVTGQVSFWNGVNSVTGDNDLYWDNTSKRLGIGTTAPDYSLDVPTLGAIRIGNGTSNSVQLIIDNNNTTDAGTETSEIRFRHYRSYVAGQNDAGSIIVGKEEPWGAAGDRNSYMSFSTRTGTAGATEKMRIDSNGKVGIGISPSKKLTVFGTGPGEATVQIEGEGGADPYINFLVNNAQHWSMGVDDSDAYKFKISEHSALGTNDYFTVDVTGNVGIGIASPSEKLEVGGPIVWNGSLVASQTSSGVLDRSGDNIRIRAYGATTGSGILQIRTGGGGNQVDTLALTIDELQNATFAGRVIIGDDAITTDKPGLVVGDITNNGQITIRGGQPTLFFDKSGSNDAVILTDSGSLKFKNGTLDSEGSDQLTLDTSGNATFAGDTQAPKFIAAQGTTYANGYQLTRTAHDTYRICLGDSEGLRIVNETDSNREELAFDGAGNATFAGNVLLGGSDDYIAFNTSGSGSDPKIKMNSDASFTFLNTAGSTSLTLENNGNATFTGDVVANGTIQTLVSNANLTISGDASGNVYYSNAAGEHRWRANGSSVNSMTLSSSLLTVNENATFAAKVNVAGSTNNESSLNVKTASGSIGSIGFETGSEVTGIISSNTELMEFRVGDGVGIGDAKQLKIDPDGIEVTGDVEIANSSDGLILQSPDGTRYRVTVANGGTLSVSAV